MSARPIAPLPLPRDVRPVKARDFRFGEIVREPTDNVIGRFKILRRTDNLFALLDLDAPVSVDALVFESESEARDYAIGQGVADRGRRT